MRTAVCLNQNLSLSITVGKSSHYIKYKKQLYEIKNFAFQITNPCWLMKMSQKLLMHRRRWFYICLPSVSWSFLWWLLWLIGHPYKFTTSPLQSGNTMPLILEGLSWLRNALNCFQWHHKNAIIIIIQFLNILLTTLEMFLFYCCCAIRKTFST